MKTLDEVIFEAPYSPTPWEADALHYLKVLKDILDPLKVKKITHEITCPQCNSVIAIFLPESNKPLTWDELKGMEGKPVWVEYTYQGEWRPDKGEWIIINSMGDDYLIDQTGEEFNPKSLYGKTWQAYRKERELGKSLVKLGKTGEEN